MGVSGTAKSTPFFENNPMNTLKVFGFHARLYDVNFFYGLPGLDEGGIGPLFVVKGGPLWVS